MARQIRAGLQHRFGERACRELHLQGDPLADPSAADKVKSNVLSLLRLKTWRDSWLQCPQCPLPSLPDGSTVQPHGNKKR
jgi:hypothetical protein